LSQEFFHKLLVKHEDKFVKWLGRSGRGVWSPAFEAYAKKCLRHDDMYKHVKFLDIEKALLQVAMQPHGFTHTESGFDAFAFCHKFGLLYTKQPIAGRQIKFTFPSPLHRRVAYRRLVPGREPDAVLRNLSLRQICTNAIARFSPATLENRQSSRPTKSRSIPEAAFQDELYCCLSIELQYLPILSAYSHTKKGRIDFYVSDRKWGIEILQSGNNEELTNDIARFETGGKYSRWDSMDDYIILNFCPRSALSSLRLSGMF
jgi:hypothetical protein